MPHGGRRTDDGECGLHLPGGEAPAARGAIASTAEAPKPAASSVLLGWEPAGWAEELELRAFASGGVRGTETGWGRRSPKEAGGFLTGYIPREAPPLASLAASTANERPGQRVPAWGAALPSPAGREGEFLLEGWLQAGGTRVAALGAEGRPREVNTGE